MPTISFRDLLSTLLDTIEPIYYQAGAFFVLSILDDPAMLAFAFC